MRGEGAEVERYYARDRTSRDEARERAPSRAEAESSAEPRRLLARSAPSGREPAPAPGSGTSGGLRASTGAGAGGRGASADADRATASVAEAEAGQPVRIVLDPMRGVALDASRLLLFRTVVVDGRGYRQGLLIDTQALGRWLEQSVIEPSGLAGILDARFAPDAEPDPAPDAYEDRHRFAEPFDGLWLALRVAPLAGADQTRAIMALGALLAAVGVVGLLAVDRMASVVFEFAERRSNFVAAVSHELKTPLTAIRMYAEMLRDGLVDGEAKRAEYHATISDESERLSRLIDNVLEFSRLERGQREFSLVVGSLGDAVAEVAEKLRPHVERAGFVLQLEIGPALPPVRLDRDALTQMVFNLIDNAMKYAVLADERRIVLRCARDADGRVGVSVRDFGPGISQRQLSRIFEPFYRGEEELTRTTQGSGIGLALVKDLAAAMGASVRGENPVGGGFEVTIAFAAARS
jgi:signal transduction histidine kinase